MHIGDRKVIGVIAKRLIDLLCNVEESPAQASSGSGLKVSGFRAFRCRFCAGAFRVSGLGAVGFSADSDRSLCGFLSAPPNLVKGCSCMPDAFCCDHLLFLRSQELYTPNPSQE